MGASFPSDDVLGVDKPRDKTAPVDRVVMPQVPGWYLVEVTGLIRQPDSGFQVDYCRHRAASDGGGMEWVGNYRQNVVAWHELPKRVQSA